MIEIMAELGESMQEPNKKYQKKNATGAASGKSGGDFWQQIRHLTVNKEAQKTNAKEKKDDFTQKLKKAIDKNLKK